MRGGKKQASTGVSYLLFHPRDFFFWNGKFLAQMCFYQNTVWFKNGGKPSFFSSNINSKALHFSKRQNCFLERCKRKKRETTTDHILRLTKRDTPRSENHESGEWPKQDPGRIRKRDCGKVPVFACLLNRLALESPSGRFATRAPTCLRVAAARPPAMRQTRSSWWRLATLRSTNRRQEQPLCSVGAGVERRTRFAGRVLVELEPGRLYGGIFVCARSSTRMQIKTIA